MKRPFEALKEIFFENLDKVKENQRHNFSNSEKLMVWVVGFSIGGLSIIVTNLTSFNQSFSHVTLKIILVLLSVSIFSGILYRWAFYMWQIQYQSIEFYLHGAFSNKEMININPDDISEVTDINEILRLINIDFGEDLSHVLEEYNKSNQDDKDKILKRLKTHYKRTGEWAKKDYENAIEYVKETYELAFGISRKKINKMFEQSPQKKLKMFGWTVTICLSLSCISFVSVLIILCIEY